MPDDDFAEGIITPLVGGGIITLALFPVAVPIIALTVVAVIPLLVVPLLLGILALPIVLVRSVVRRVRRSRRLRSSGQPRSDGRRDPARSSGSPSHAALEA